MVPKIIDKHVILWCLWDFIKQLLQRRGNIPGSELFVLLACTSYFKVILGKIFCYHYLYENIVKLMFLVRII